MKKHLLIICMLASMVFCKNAFGQDAAALADLDSLLNMQGKYEQYKDPAAKRKYDRLLNDRRADFPQIRVNESGDTLTTDGPGAIVFEHKSEAYIYVPKRVAINLLCETGGLNLHLDKSSGAQGAGFSESIDITSTGRVSYAAQGNFNRVKFYVKKGDSTKKTFYLCFLDNANYVLGDSPELLDTVGLGFKSDTLRLYRKDTIRTLKVLEPKYSVYQSLELNGRKIDQLPSVTDYNDPESTDCIEIDFESHWANLKDGANTVTVKVATFDENCNFAKVTSKDYVIVVEADPKSFPWIMVIGVVVILLSLAVIFVVQCNMKKVLKKLSACKTKICNVLDDKSASLDEDEKLEGLLQRVTALIDNLRCKKLLKKADKEECGNLLKEIDDYLRLLDQSDSGSESEPVSNDELLAKIAKLEEKLSKAEDEKMEALAEQKTKLDELHEKAVNELKKQLEQKHEKELQAQKDQYEKKLANLSEKHAKELAEQEQRHKEELNALTEKYETKLRQTEEEHRRQIAEIEEKCVRAIANLAKELEEVRSKWQEDKKYVVNMYRAYETGIGDMVESMKSNGDDVAPAYTEMLQIHSESVHSFQSFHDQFQAIMEKELTIAEMREELAKVFSVHIDYERSWINALCRLHAYSKVEKLAPMFGLYNEYKVDISELYVQFLALASILGFENIHVPELFVEEFHSSEAESDNTNLVLPNIYPNYVEALVSSTIYDIHTIGYTYDGTTRKPKVAYYV